MPPPEGKRRGLRRLVPGRRRREEPGAEADAQAEAVAGEPGPDAAGEGAGPELPAEEPEPLSEEDELAARFDAARERLQATIKPPPPDDG